MTFTWALCRLFSSILHSTPLISIDAPGSRESDHNMSCLDAGCAGSCDKGLSYVPCLQLLLTVWAGHVTSINILPDDVLLLIFHCDGLEDSTDLGRSLSWHRLIHVCKRWRTIVFGSPNFLDLRLVCGPCTTHVENIGIWPPFPIVMKDHIYLSNPKDYDFNVLVHIAIAHRSRVCEINLANLTSSQLRRLTPAMQETFPALKHLCLGWDDDLIDDSPAPVLPDGFLGGSAPLLRSLKLSCNLFPVFPQLLLSTTDLVELELWDISYSELISPEEIVINLALLVNLKSFTIGFESPPPHLDLESRHPPPLTRSTLPTLTYLEIGGTSKYLENFLVRIDAPLLNAIHIKFFDQPIFNNQQLSQFIGRTPKLKTFEEAHISCFNSTVTVELDPRSSKFIKLEFSCIGSDLEPSLLMSSLPPLPTVERLYFDIAGLTPIFEDHWCIKNTQWFELSHSFTALKELHFVSKKFTSTIMPMLQAIVGERVTEVLPALRNIFLPEFELSGPIQEAIQQLVTARQLSGHPLTFHMSTLEKNHSKGVSVAIPIN